MPSSFRAEKISFLVLMFELVIPGEGSVLTTAALFDLIRRSYIPNIEALLSERKNLKYVSFFSFCCHGNQSYRLNSIILTALVEFYLRNIPIAFHQDWPGGGLRRRRCLKNFDQTDRWKPDNDPSHYLSLALRTQMRYIGSVMS